MRAPALTALAIVLALAGTAVAAEFSADTVTVMPGGTESGKIYFKPPGILRSESMGMVLIAKHPLVTHLFPDRRVYVVTNVEEDPARSPMTGARNFDQWIADNHLRRLGAETVEGFDCEVYAGDVAFAEGQPPTQMKIWYSKKLQYPVKSESTLPATMGKVSNSLKNIRIGPQPDDLFEVPAGYTREENLQSAMGMGGFQPPAAGEGGQPPSAEQMEEMMKGMQEMMKKRQKQ